MTRVYLRGYRSNRKDYLKNIFSFFYILVNYRNIYLKYKPVELFYIDIGSDC